jgi:hypothetical protein
LLGAFAYLGNVIMKKYTKKHPKIHRFIWDVEYLSYRYWLIVIIGFSIIFPIVNYFNKKEANAYKHCEITWGIVDKIRIARSKGTSYINFHFFDDSNKLIIHEIGFFPDDFVLGLKCYEDRKIGDTVIIKYSKIDNSFAKIIECYWNDNLKKKYGFYKW